jgi:hypothetical protein
MRTARRGRAGRAVMAFPDPGAVGPDTLGGYKRSPTGAGDTWRIGLWHRKDL